MTSIAEEMFHYMALKKKKRTLLRKSLVWEVLIQLVPAVSPFKSFQADDFLELNAFNSKYGQTGEGFSPEKQQNNNLQSSPETGYRETEEKNDEVEHKGNYCKMSSK